MRKPNCLHLFLTAAALAALPSLAVSTRAAVGDIYETNMEFILRFPFVGTPITFAAGLNNPKGLAFDGNGKLYVANAGAGTIVYFNHPDGSPVTYVGGLSSPVGVTFDLAGNLYVGESGTGSIIKFAQDGTRTTFATGLGSPAGLAFASSGNLFVADFSGGAIYEVTPAGAKTTFAIGLNFPSGLAFDSAGNLFEADSESGTIFKFAPDGTRSAFATGLGRPYGVAFEAAGSLIVSDNEEGATYRFTPAGVRTTVFSSEFNTPQFVAIEPTVHQMLNISTRGSVNTGNNILIAGFVIGGNGPVGTPVVVRALGPSLTALGITDALANPALELRNASGTLLGFNNNWKDNSATDQSRLNQLNLAPTNDQESAVLAVLGGGSYTAIVYGFGGTTGTALVEVYNLQ